MERVTSGGTGIAWTRAGEGAPVLLVHGFASTHQVNWVAPGWIDPLIEAGFGPLMLDMRGHGQSGAPHEESAYGWEVLAGDLAAVLDAAGAERAPVFGYSMGAMAALQAAALYPQRFSAVLAGGVGETLLKEHRDPEPVLSALLTDDPSTITDAGARLFRRFAEQNGQDLEAMAACWRATRGRYPMERLEAIEAPVLIIAGESDTAAGDPTPLAERLLKGRSHRVPGRDHMRTVGDKETKQAVTAFLNELR